MCEAEAFNLFRRGITAKDLFNLKSNSQKQLK